MAKDEWVRVRSEDELRAGMTVELRPCSWCGKRERFMLFRVTGRFAALSATGECFKARIFSVPSTCEREGYRRDETGFFVSIREGRLYRLADLDTTDDAEVSELEREDA